MNYRFKMVIAEDEPAILRGICKAIREIDEMIDIVAAVTDGMEAYNKIMEESPDIVISDIKMPVMDGLEVLEKITAAQIKTKFILLTGYEKFEYARKALQYGAVNYLLKPINLQKLRCELTELEIQILRERKKTIAEAVHAYYMKDQIPDCTLIKKNTGFLIIDCIYGCLGRSGFDEFHISSQLVKPLDEKIILELEEQYGVFVCQENGFYQNEMVFIVVMPDPRDYTEELVKNIYKKLLDHHIFLSVGYSDYLTEFSAIPLLLNHIRINLSTLIVFQKNQLISILREGEAGEIKVSGKMREICEAISVTMTKTELKNLIKGICDFWYDNQATQLMLMEDIKYLFHMILKKVPSMPEAMIEVSEILFYAYNYDDLYQLLFDELNRILFKIYKKSKEDNSLPKLVREYLDKHFTEQIEYGELDKVFGYNVRYISSVFKDAYGMSPSKYVIDCKIKLAKKILLENKGVLLKEVSHIVGYEDALYFSRVFHSNTGMSPSQFIKQNGGQ
ncbi:MAG: response regulator [Lachnospiraceae bacterium]